MLRRVVGASVVAGMVVCIVVVSGGSTEIEGAVGGWVGGGAVVPEGMVVGTTWAPASSPPPTIRIPVRIAASPAKPISRAVKLLRLRHTQPFPSAETQCSARRRRRGRSRGLHSVRQDRDRAC